MTVEYQKVWRTMNDLELVTSKICSAREIIDNAVDKIQGQEYNKAEILMNTAYEFLEYYLQEFDDKFKLAWQATVGDLRDNNVGTELFTCDKNDPSPECQGAWNDFWEEPQQYTEEELNAMCDKAELDAELEQIRKEGGYDWTPEVSSQTSQDKKYKNQNGVTYNEYLNAKINAESHWNDGWTKEHYQKIVDKYEGKTEKVTKWILPISEIGDTQFVTFPDDLLEASKLKEGDEVEWIDNKNGSYTIRKV